MERPPAALRSLAPVVRTLGVEEELLLVDPATGQVASRAEAVLARRREQGQDQEPQDAADELDHELFRHQVEVRTEPTRSVEELRADLVRARRTAGEAARALGLAAVASGTIPRDAAEVVTPEERYRAIVAQYADVARAAGTCGMHVHVAIGSPEEGVAVLDRVAPWLPLLVAVAANSPFSEDHDTGYASWRGQVWSRWPSAGPTEAFGSLERYREVCRWMVASGGARDDGMLYLDARLAAEHPTVELRVADVCTDLEDALLVAALGRGLVETAARAHAEGRPAPAWRSEMLRVAHWRATRYAATEQLLHPVDGDLRPAREVLDVLRAEVADALAESGDTALVDAGLARAATGGGASRQRAAWERTGSVAGVVDDLVERTEASWTSDPPGTTEER